MYKVINRKLAKFYHCKDAFMSINNLKLYEQEGQSNLIEKPVHYKGLMQFVCCLFLARRLPFSLSDNVYEY